MAATVPTAESTSVRPRPKPPLPRRVASWVVKNLFSSWFNGLLTVGSAWLIYFAASRLWRWAAETAQWGVISANLQLFLIGTYPRAQLWRYYVILAYLLLMVALSVACALHEGFRRKVLRWLVAPWLLFLPFAMFMLWGLPGNAALPHVQTSSWGGLTLTLILAAVGIAGSLPIGILLALGRRSSLPVISLFCTLFIEIVRGTPLVAVIFMAHLMVPVFLPDVTIDRVVRAMIGFTLFTSAYMAENVRGGLQSVPKGQYEAALALGMSPTATMLIVILPQALRAVLPSIVGQFISLLKDTSLVSIIGLLDLLGIARSITANPAWAGQHAEVYLFAALLYWIFCFALSYGSRRLERMLGIERTA